MYDPKKYNFHAKELKWIGVDLDNTIARPVWPEPGIGEPIPERVATLLRAVAKGYKISIDTSRPWGDYPAIEQWLNDNGIPWNHIRCGKPLYHRFVDDKNILPDSDDWTI